jgi:hypothetical protein
MKARFIQETGTRAWLRIYWGECPHGGCHNAMKHLADSDKLDQWELGGKPEDYPDPAQWPTHCEDCGAPIPEGHFLCTDGSYSDGLPQYQVLRKRLYNTASGQPEPGDLFWASWYHDPERRSHCMYWDNCSDPRGHLVAVLPNGHHWDIDSRATNCGSKDDRTHRCWVRHGEPPNVTVDKAGDTCSAGAGSILAAGWHGFLVNGEFRQC